MTESILARRDKGQLTEKTRQTLIGELRNTVVICALSCKHEEKGKITQDQAYAVLKKGVARAERILKELAETDNL